MPLIATTPRAPYYAVIFTSLRTTVDEGYGDMATRMLELAALQPGFLGVESARESDGAGLGITVSYWKDLASIAQWKANAEHLHAQRLGHEKWYSAFTTRIAYVERDYSL
jgi:heme-degrading monooxygenase HmoA